jgi:hypothetical protein
METKGEDMTLKAAFIFLAPEVDPQKDRQTVVTPQVELTAVAVGSYAEAEAVAVELVNEGIEAIELCGGFGNRGTARITDAVAGKAAVGVVRFDGHPGLGGKSGDELF